MICTESRVISLLFFFFSNNIMSVKDVTELKTNAAPSARTSVGLCKSETSIYIYGGCCVKTIFLNDMWYLNGMRIYDGINLNIQYN